MRKTLRLMVAAFLALLSTLALWWAKVDYTAVSGTTSALEPLRTQAFPASIVVIVLWWLYAGVLSHTTPWQRGDRLKLCLLSGVFAGIAAIGAAYRGADADLDYFLTPVHVLFMLTKAFGYFALLFFGLQAILNALPTLATQLRSQPLQDARTVRRNFLLAWVCIACCWIPSFVARFPGAVAADVGRALQQYYGELMLTSDHPLAYTWLVGSILSLGSRIAGDNFGVFLFALIQFLFLSGVMAFSVSELHRQGYPSSVRWGLTVLYALLPMSMFNAGAIIKDIFYSATFLAYLLCTVRAFREPVKTARSPWWWLCYGLFTSLVLLLRHNGLMTVLPMTVVLLVLMVTQGEGATRWRSALLAAPLALLLLFNGLIVPQYAYPVSSTADLLGVPLQQVARILRDAPEDVDAKAFSAIDRLVIADSLGSAYRPKGSDAVRKNYRYEAKPTTADLLSFAGTWATLVAAHPMTAFHAFWSMEGGYLDPFDTTNRYFNTMVDPASSQYPTHLNIAHPASLQPIQQTLLVLENAYRGLPLIAQLDSVGFFLWALLLGWFLVERTPSRALAWVLVAPLSVLLGCLLSSGFAAGTRYALPIVYTAPYLLCVLLRPVLAQARNGDPSNASFVGKESH